MFWFPPNEETKPIINLVPLENLCKYLSGAFHWNIEIEVDESDSLIFIKKNGMTIKVITKYKLAKNYDNILKDIDNRVRTGT